MDSWTQIGGNLAPLDAHFRVEEASGQISLVLQARGGRKGTPGGRNTEYGPGLQALLERLGRLDAVITDAFVDSSQARKLPRADRRIHIPRGYPVKLAQVSDMSSLRFELMKAQTTVARSPGAAGSSGNRTKRIRLCLKFGQPRTPSFLTTELGSTLGVTGEEAARSRGNMRRGLAGNGFTFSESAQCEPEVRQPPVLRREISKLVAALADEVASVVRSDPADSEGSPNGISGVADLQLMLDSMGAVGATVQQLQNALAEFASRSGLPSARSRIRSYLLQHIGEPVTTYELNGAAGIQASARRIRELREEGLAITAGPADGVSSGEYRLEAGANELALAARWRLLNEIRTSEQSVAQRILLLLQGDHPRLTPRDDLRLIASPGLLQAALDELELSGWSVVEEMDSASGSRAFRLANLRRTATSARRSTEAREVILTRDGRKCRSCGATSGSKPDVILQVHRHRTTADGLADHSGDLETLCSRCHNEVHRDDGIDGASDEVLFPHRDPWHRT